jgi:hypothetical protein
VTWVKLLLALLAMGNSIANIIRERKLLQAGEDLALAKGMAQLAARLELGQTVQKEIEALTDDELNTALRGE